MAKDMSWWHVAPASKPFTHYKPRPLIADAESLKLAVGSLIARSVSLQKAIDEQAARRAAGKAYVHSDITHGMRRLEAEVSGVRRAFERYQTAVEHPKLCAGGTTK